MSADEKAEHFFLAGEPFCFRPARYFRKRWLLPRQVCGWRGIAEQVALARLDFFRTDLRFAYRDVEPGHQLRAMSELVTCASLDQRFQHTLADHAQIDAINQIEKRFERAILVAGIQNG